MPTATRHVSPRCSARSTCTSHVLARGNLAAEAPYDPLTRPEAWRGAAAPQVARWGTYLHLSLEPGSTWHAEQPEFEDATSELAPGTSKRPSRITHTPTASMLGNSRAIWFGPRAGVARLPLHSTLCSGVGGRARSGETHYRGVWSGEPAQSRCTTPPLCSGGARTTAGDLPPPLGALPPRKGYPSGKDEGLASHPGELRRLSAVCMRPQFSTWVLGGVS
eukprot:COSAG03_NODE_1576_length_3845_cov_6.988254_5_plen_220_part_00